MTVRFCPECLTALLRILQQTTPPLKKRRKLHRTSHVQDLVQYGTNRSVVPTAHSPVYYRQFCYLTPLFSITLLNEGYE